MEKIANREEKKRGKNEKNAEKRKFCGGYGKFTEYPYLRGRFG